jgi:hypothetical protein
VSDIDTVVVDSLKTLDPKRPIREGDVASAALFGEKRPTRAVSLESNRVVSVRKGAVAFRFLRHPSRPSEPRPVTNAAAAARLPLGRQERVGARFVSDPGGDACLALRQQHLLHRLFGVADKSKGDQPAVAVVVGPELFEAQFAAGDKRGGWKTGLCRMAQVTEPIRPYLRRTGASQSGTFCDQRAVASLALD